MITTHLKLLCSISGPFQVQEPWHSWEVDIGCWQGCLYKGYAEAQGEDTSKCIIFTILQLLYFTKWKSKCTLLQVIKFWSVYFYQCRRALSTVLSGPCNLLPLVLVLRCHDKQKASLRGTCPREAEEGKMTEKINMSPCMYSCHGVGQDQNNFWMRSKLEKAGAIDGETRCCWALALLHHLEPWFLPSHCLPSPPKWVVWCDGL